MGGRDRPRVGSGLEIPAHRKTAVSPFVLQPSNLSAQPAGYPISRDWAGSLSAGSPSEVSAKGEAVPICASTDWPVSDRQAIASQSWFSTVPEGPQHEPGR